MTCNDDLSPIILAIALQIPLVGAAIIGWLKYHSEVRKNKTKVSRPSSHKEV